MIQREIRHPDGAFPCCRCGAEPRHIQARGTSSREPFDPCHPTGTRHALECRCGAHTPWLPTLAAAVHDWRGSFAKSPTAMVASVRPLMRLPHPERA